MYNFKKKKRYSASIKKECKVVQKTTFRQQIGLLDVNSVTDIKNSMAWLGNTVEENIPEVRQRNKEGKWETKYRKVRESVQEV